MDSNDSKHVTNTAQLDLAAIKEILKNNTIENNTIEKNIVELTKILETSEGDIKVYIQSQINALKSLNESTESGIQMLNG